MAEAQGPNTFAWRLLLAQYLRVPATIKPTFNGSRKQETSNIGYWDILGLSVFVRGE